MDNQPNSGVNLFPDQKQSLPNATAVLVLGIISILTCFCYGIVGIICAIIALVLAKKDNVAYAANPELYIPSSYSNLKAGRICAIIGIVLSAIYLIAVIVLVSSLGVAGLSHMSDILKHQQ